MEGPNCFWKMKESLYRRLILKAQTDGARLHTTASQITRRRTSSPAQANQLYTFLWGQLYNGKIAHRYGKQPTSACRLCGLPDSCTHIAGTCPANTAHIIKKHNAAVQLVHTAIRKASKGGAALHRSPLTLLCCDAGITPQTTTSQLHAITHPHEPPCPPTPDNAVAHLLDHLDPTSFAPTKPTDIQMSPWTLTPTSFTSIPKCPTHTLKASTPHATSHRGYRTSPSPLHSATRVWESPLTSSMLGESPTPPAPYPHL
jgi:hypothetical protein